MCARSRRYERGVPRTIVPVRSMKMNMNLSVSMKIEKRGKDSVGIGDTRSAGTVRQSFHLRRVAIGEKEPTYRRRFSRVSRAPSSSFFRNAGRCFVRTAFAPFVRSSSPRSARPSVRPSWCAPLRRTSHGALRLNDEIDFQNYQFTLFTRTYMKRTRPARVKRVNTLA